MTRPGAATAAEIRTLLARAYHDDPLMAWIFPDEDVRLEASAAWLGVAVERYLAQGEVATARDAALIAVALWRTPESFAAAAPDTLPTAGGLLRALVGEPSARRVAEGFAAAREQAPPPEQPYFYLHFLAVAPGAQGRGLGGELLERVVGRARDAATPLRLETTNPANLAFYERHGLRLTSEVRLGPTGPTMWAFEAH